MMSDDQQFPAPTRHSRPWFLILWLLLSGALGAVALLNLIPAPTFTFWLLSVAASEWGHWLALVALMLLLLGWPVSRRTRLLLGLPLLAVLLLMLPLLRAVPVATALPAQLEAAFGAPVRIQTTDTPARPHPLVLPDLWLGIAAPPLQAERVTYIERNGQPLTLDVYLPPATAQPAPGVLVIHGGGWQSGDSTQLATLNRYLAARGYVVAALNYRLAPRHPFPAARDDVQAALAYLRTHATELGLDAERLVLIGRSAGGQLALLVAYTAEDPTIRGVVALYSPTDLPFGYRHPTNPAVLDSRELLAAYLGGTLAEAPDVYAAASPITFVSPTTPPTLLLHGARDDLVLVEHSDRLAARLEQAEVPHMLLRLPWATHGCDANFSGPCGQVSTYAIERFLAAVMENHASDDR
jgi:acetyl esterase/lipase